MSSSLAPDARFDRLVVLRLAVATFSILALELAIIRWMSQQVRIFAYLNNVVLMACFLGMGLGIAAGRKHPRLIDATLPSLAVLSAVLSFSARLGILRLAFPDPSIAIWGGETLRTGETFLKNLSIVVALFLAVVWIFVCAGSVVGALFDRLNPLRAYGADLFGSLAGVLAMTFVAALGTTPTVWFAVAIVPLLWLSPRPLSWAAAAVVLWVAHLSVGFALFSPYNRIDLIRASSLNRPVIVAANRDAHQIMLDLRAPALSSAALSPEARKALSTFRLMYDLPFGLTRQRRDALIVGAGTGNDVAAALRNGFGHVSSIDIDPVIIRIGRRMHPEHPYSDPRVEPVINDARAFFEQRRDEGFDVVCFGLLDSHAMFSSMASLRLDNYVYTEEGLRSAFQHVRPGGVMTVSFSVFPGDWIRDRIIAVMAKAIGQQPRILYFPSADACTFIVTKGPVLPAAPLPFEIRPHIDLNAVHTTSDDWPFLYLRPHRFPTGYLIVLLTILAIAALGTRAAFGPGLFRTRFDPVMFLFGAAFLLIETKGVTDLSLLFGSTWIVNLSVFAGILLMALVANTVASRWQPVRMGLPFLALFLALAVSYAVRPSMLLPLPLLARGIAGGLANALPVAVAGLLFSTLLSRSADAAGSLGSNLLGAMIGGCLEYLSIATGLRFLTLMAMLLYGAALLVLARDRRDPVSADAADASM